jgi:general stress protein 26
MTDDTTKFWDMIDDIRVAMMTTETANGLESRPMSAYVDKDAHTITFITRIDSNKTDELKDDAKVNLAFANASSNKYVSVTGTARVGRDPAKQKELWNPFAEAWLPEGPEAPTVGLIHVTPDHATIWDSPGKLAMLVKVAKANITQTPPKDDKVTHVTL